MVFLNGTWMLLLSSHHYQQFYPVYGPKLRSIINETCTQEYVNYRNLNATCTRDLNQFGWGLGKADCSGYELLNCMLNALPDTAKADMAAAGIVLGLMPVILSLVGSTTAEVGILALRRPFLASMLGLASPAVNPMRTFDYRDPLEVLRRHTKPLDPFDLFSHYPWLQALLEYSLASAALVNLALVATNLTHRAIVGNDPNRDYQVLVWALWAFAIHIAGAVTLRLCVRLDRQPAASKRMPSVATVLKDEFTPCGMHAAGGSVGLCRQTAFFKCLAWATSIATIMHIVYGTLSFSGMLFLSGGEALLVLVRCLASVSLCRMILMCELAGMSRSVDVEPREPELDMMAQQVAEQVVLEKGKAADASVVEVGYTSPAV